MGLLGLFRSISIRLEIVQIAALGPGQLAPRKILLHSDARHPHPVAQNVLVAPTNLIPI
jgi:hypothetical protein